MKNVIKIEQILKKREEILKTCAKYGAYDVRIFGSIARGEADELSDIDILVKFESGRTLLDHAGLVLELEKILKCKVDVVSEKGLKPRIKNRILKEVISL